MVTSIRRVSLVLLGLIALALLGASMPLAARADPTPHIQAPVALKAESDGTGKVNLSWNFPTTSTVYDHVAVLRDNKQIVVLKGSNGDVPKSYVDTPGLNVNVSYTLVAYDAGGNKSPPSDSIDVSTIKPDPPPDTSSGTDNGSGSGTDLCKTVAVPDLAHGQAKTPEETYACTRAMTKLPRNLGVADLWYKASNFIMEPLWAFTVFIYLMAAAALGWALTASLYGGMAGFVGGIAYNFSISSTYFQLRDLVLWAGPVVIGYAVIRGRHLKALKLLGSSVLIFAGLIYVFANPAQIPNRLVAAPLAADNYLLGTLDTLSNWNAPDNNFGLRVVPTYSKDASLSGRRKAENKDWIIHQYLPLCNLYTGDVDWSTKVLIPPKPGRPQITWCEALLRSNNGDKVYVYQDLYDELKKINPAAHHVYVGKDTQGRFITLLTAGTTNGFHAVLKLMVGAIVAGATIFSLVEFALLILWGLTAMLNLEALRSWFYKKFWRLAGTVSAHVASVLGILMAYLVEGFIYNQIGQHGYGYLTMWAIVINLVMIVVVVNIFSGVYQWFKLRSVLQTPEKRHAAETALTRKHALEIEGGNSPLETGIEGAAGAAAFALGIPIAELAQIVRARTALSGGSSDGGDKLPPSPFEGPPPPEPQGPSGPEPPPPPEPPPSFGDGSGPSSSGDDRPPSGWGGLGPSNRVSPDGHGIIEGEVVHSGASHDGHELPPSVDFGSDH